VPDEIPDLSPLDAEAEELRRAPARGYPALAEDEQRAFEAQYRHTRLMRRIELGWFGWAFGSGDEKKGNIAGGAIVICFIMIAALFVLASDAPLREKVITSLVNIITLSLGYLFGHINKE